jgi:hypothetical protein
LQWLLKQKGIKQMIVKQGLGAFLCLKMRQASKMMQVTELSAEKTKCLCLMNR